ncbi:MAG TPA: Rieske 2Fe-2S domain-containing protein [Candidatus Baltobacteraceae bacterium]|nr:Rieske 2Fe-2S domain-containing protein [Candidatus Baltobacteraceae bacterium]
MPEFVRVAHAAALPPGSACFVMIERYEVALFNVEGTIYALENTCPHQGGPLADGYLEGALITCPWHAWCFDVRTGKMTLGDFASVPRFGVRVDDGEIFVSSEPIEE